jgi:hypothetical protein
VSVVLVMQRAKRMHHIMVNYDYVSFKIVALTNYALLSPNVKVLETYLEATIISSSVSPSLS